MLAKHDLADFIHLEEGSGISRDNRFTARGLAQLLHLFKPHATTLLRGGDGALYKTGTFSGVRTLAGYADTFRQGRVRFVISLKSNDGAMRFRLLKAIQSGFSRSRARRRCSPRSQKSAMGPKCEELAYMLSALSPIATEGRIFQIGSSVRIPEVTSEGSANQLTRP